MTHYDHQKIEQKWQKFWDENKTFSVKNSGPRAESRGEGKNFYALDMFPFPSGAGLHVGHPEGYTATDILCRKRRMEGYNVLHPMGWDAFGLPAENFAIKSKIHPEISTNKNIENFTRQIKSLGFSYDWDREISTTDPEYYKWTQDLFLKFYEKGLLYEDDKPMNWCPSCKVICANEEVEQGMHERCGNAVSKKALKQWMFKITDYAERLLQDLETPNVILLHGLGGNGESGWIADMQKFFESKNIPAFSPTFPNAEKPEYSEWKIFFEANILKKITPQTIIIGHSLGCGFMQRYLSEETLPNKFSELIFVAPTVSDCGIPEISNFFTEKFDSQKISGSVENIFIYAGGKDPYITTAEFKTLAEKTSAQLIFDEQQEHFWGDWELKKFPALVEKCEKISESVLDWPHKIKAMQKNWIGKSSGLLFTSPLITEYTKKRTEHDSFTGGHSKDDSASFGSKQKRGTNSLEGGHLDQNKSGNNRRSSQSISILLSKIPQVKKRRVRGSIGKIQVSQNNFIFDGFELRKHWEGKSNQEIKFREEFSITVLKNLNNLYFISKDFGIFEERNKVFVVFFETLKTGEKRVITYFKSDELSKAYQHAKKTKTLEIQTYSSHFEAFKADTFFVIAPDHPLLPDFVEGVPNKEGILAECRAIVARRDARGFEEEKESEGIFTGRYIQDPVGNGKLPLWVASYALADYGTGIVKCSCHDERDFAFAKKYNIPMKPVLFPENSEEAEKVKNLEYCYSNMKAGILTEPAEFSGKKAGGLRKKIAEYAEANNLAQEETNYKLRDWIFTRQRYWGEPIPLVFDEAGKCYPLDVLELPVLLPETPNYEPSETGESPLAKITDWVNVKGYITKNGTVRTLNGVESPETSEEVEIQNFRRETSTMPNWAGSSWYWLRFMDAKNKNEAWSKEAEKQWGAVDLYVGGAEHAVLHLLYARFWHKALFDMGLVSTKEPFKKLVNQGMILSYAFEKQTAGGGLVAVDEVETRIIDGEEKYFWNDPDTSTPLSDRLPSEFEVKKITAKMSKSLKNVVNPDDIVEQFGADTLRMYEMFMGPFEQSKEWNTKAVEGMHKFLARIHRYFSEKEISESCPSKELISLTHKTVKKVSQDIEEFKFNTAISQMMVWMNEFSKLDTIPKISGGKFVRLLAPFAPHLAEELWKKFKPNPSTPLEDRTITFESWPSYTEALTIDSEMTYGVQVNGKVRGELKISKDAPKEECLAKAKELEKVQKFLNEAMENGGQIRKEIFVPQKIIGFVVK